MLLVVLLRVTVLHGASGGATTSLIVKIYIDSEGEESGTVVSLHRFFLKAASALQDLCRGVYITIDNYGVRSYL